MDEEKIYSAILDELRENGPRQGLWAKCFTETNGDENAAKALYFKYRTEQLANEALTATPKSNSTELTKSFSSTEKIVPSVRLFDKSNLVVVMLFIIFGLCMWAFAEKRDTEIRKAEDSQAKEQLTKRMAEIKEFEIIEAEKKKRFNDLHATLPDFNFDKERQNCLHISDSISQASYRSCVLDLLEVSNARIKDVKNKFHSTLNDSSYSNPISNTFKQYDEIQKNWCDTFIGFTWGQGNGVVGGVANCKITLNALLGKTLRTVAANYSNSNSASIGFSKNLYSNSHATCKDEDCQSKIRLKTVEYKLKIESFLNSEKVLENYEGLPESSRVIWTQSIDKTFMNHLMLSNYICKDLATLSQIENQKNLHSNTECEISLDLFWLDEFSIQYENFQKK